MAARIPWLVLALAVSSGALAAPGPPPPGYTLVRVTDAVPASAMGDISQLAFRPGDPVQLFAVRSGAGAVVRFDVDFSTGALTNAVNVATGLPAPLGLAFRGADLYVSLNPANDSRITRLRDLDQNGSFESRVDFVRGVPNRDHGIDQLQIAGKSLFAPIGTRWNSGNPTCEGTVYTGTLARIADLDEIVYDGVANYLPTQAEFINPDPVDGYLRRYACGLRNPFGLRVDDLGRVFVSDNGASACNTCSSCSNFPIDTPDFFYADVPVGAKAQFPPAGYPGGGDATISPLATLAAHVAVTGFDWIATGPDAGKIVLAEFGSSTPPVVGHDLVLLDPVSGAVSTMVSGFGGPTDVLADPIGRLWIADYIEPAIYLLTPPGITGVAGPHRSEQAPLLERIRPNPSKGAVTVDYSLRAPGQVTVRILDVAGREVARVHPREQPAGAHACRVGADRALPAGVYLCRVEASVGHTQRRFVVLP